MDPNTATATATLGHFVAAHRWDDVPEPLRHQARRALLNAIGCALGVANDPAVAIASRTMQPFSGPATATVIGRPERLDAMAAAFVNTIAANLLDFDDTHQATVIHPTAPVAPAALALAERDGNSGAELLHAFLLGAEVECRIGLAVSPAHYARGWHITSTCGVFGAAAACARLLRLSPAQAATALGIAASQSAGLVENLANAAKNVAMGNAARNGMGAALFAQAGYDAAPTALEGRLGWARATGGALAPSATAALGEHWEFASNTYKPYPSGIVFHAVIEAGLALRDTPPDAIAAIEVRGDQLLLDRGDRPTNTPRDARVSIAHNVAVALARGRATVPDFEQPALDDPAVARLRNLVTASLDPSLVQGAAIVTLRLHGGETRTARVDQATGGPANPMTDAALEAKFRTNDGTEAATARIRDIWALDRAPTVRALMRSLAAPPSPDARKPAAMPADHADPAE